MNIYVKSVSESQVNAMDTLGENLDLCNVRATSGESGRIEICMLLICKEESGAEGES
jgi:hypothetical protein